MAVTQQVAQQPRLTGGRFVPLDQAAADHRFSYFVTACVLFAVINWAVSAYLDSDHKSTDQSAVLNRIQAAVTPLPIDKTFIAWTTRDWLSRVPAPQVVLMGSSQMAAASFSCEAEYLNQVVDCVEHRDVYMLGAPISAVFHRPVQVFNWSQSGAMISDDYLITSNLFVGTHVPQIVVVGVSPRDFIDNTLPCFGSTESFRFLAHYVDLDKYIRAAFPDFMSRLGWAIDSLPLQTIKQNMRLALHYYVVISPTVPIMHTSPIARTLPIVHIAPEDNRSTRAGAIKVAGAVWQDDDLTHVEPGKWRLPAVMPKFYTDNTTEYLHRYKNSNPPGYKPQLMFFNRLLTTMHDRNIIVMVVGMPSMTANRSLLPSEFWSRWRQYIAGQCNQYGYPWIDLSDSDAFTKDDFMDTVHLNAAGGRKLLNTIQLAIANNPAAQARLVKSCCATTKQ